MVAGDTAGVPNGIGGFGSRQTVTAGGSTHAAALELREKAIKAASHQLEAAEEDLELAGGTVRVRGVPELSVTLKDLARALSGMKGYSRPKDMPPSLEATADFLPHDVTYGFATHVVEAEVDPGTGGVRILRYVIANDSGRIVNPMLADGQLQGGAAHGIGNALFEWMGYDEHGQPVVTTLADYLLPTATEVPNFEIIHCEYPFDPQSHGGEGDRRGGDDSRRGRRRGRGGRRPRPVLGADRRGADRAGEAGRAHGGGSGRRRLIAGAPPPSSSFPRKRESMRPENGVSREDTGVPPAQGTKLGRGANFRCLMSAAPIPGDYWS